MESNIANTLHSLLLFVIRIHTNSWSSSRDHVQSLNPRSFFFLFDDILYIFIFTFTRYIKNQSNQNLLTHNIYLRKKLCCLKKKVVRRDLIEFKLSISHVDDIHVYAYIYIYIRLGKLYKNNSEVHSSLLINRNFLTNWQITFIAIFFFFFLNMASQNDTLFCRISSWYLSFAHHSHLFSLVLFFFPSLFFFFVFFFLVCFFFVCSFNCSFIHLSTGQPVTFRHRGIPEQ